MSAQPILFSARRETRSSADHFKRFATMSESKMDRIPKGFVQISPRLLHSSLNMQKHVLPPHEAIGNKSEQTDTPS